MKKTTFKIGMIALTLILGIFTWQSCNSDYEFDNHYEKITNKTNKTNKKIQRVVQDTDYQEFELNSIEFFNIIDDLKKDELEFIIEQYYLIQQGGKFDEEKAKIILNNYEKRTGKNLLEIINKTTKQYNKVNQKYNLTELTDRKLLPFPKSTQFTLGNNFIKFSQRIKSNTPEASSDDSDDDEYDRCVEQCRDNYNRTVKSKWNFYVRNTFGQTAIGVGIGGKMAGFYGGFIGGAITFIGNALLGRKNFDEAVKEAAIQKSQCIERCENCCR